VRCAAAIALEWADCGGVVATSPECVSMLDELPSDLTSMNTHDASDLAFRASEMPPNPAHLHAHLPAHGSMKSGSTKLHQGSGDRLPGLPSAAQNNRA